MARNISQIYAEALYTRNNYLQLTELNNGRTNSKMSIMNLITYVMAVLIHTYEVALDIFQVDIATIISNRINGTAPYYVTIAKYFQFNPETQTGDTLKYNTDTYKIEYETVDETHRIIAQSSYENYGENDAIILKVCKETDDSTEIENGTLYTQLSDAELTAFKKYIGTIKFAGAKIYCLSNPGDILVIHSSEDAPIYYNDSLVTKAQALQNVKNALAEFVKTLEYDPYIRYQQVIDVIQNAYGVTDVSSSIVVGICQYNNQTGTYGSEIKITGRVRTGSGFVKFLDNDGNSTIDSITLISETSRNEKLSKITTIQNDTRADVEYSMVDGKWVSNEKTTSVEKDVYTQKYEKELTKANMVKLNSDD